MKLRSDWHIHTQNSCDGACATVKDLVRGLKTAGIESYGFTDHVHTRHTLPDITKSRVEYESDADPAIAHLGVEASCISQWELDELEKDDRGRPPYGIRMDGPPAAPPAIAITPEIKKEYSIEYVVAGTHWGLYVPMERDPIVRDYHRQNMFLVTHELVDVLAHPWWWMGYWQNDDGSYTTDPWLDDFGKVPESMHDELAAAAIENRTLIEVNGIGILLNGKYPERFRRQYCEFLAGMKARGVTFTFGSDCHSGFYDAEVEEVCHMLTAVGITEGDFWNEVPSAFKGLNTDDS